MSAFDLPTWDPLDLWIGGPTASGKSDVAIRVAEHLNAEIVGVDSMQVYQGLDIGTAKPSREEQNRVRHHLIDVVQLKDPFSAADYLAAASRAIQEIHRRGKTVVLCGGTGLYFKALFHGLGSGPAPDPAIRRDIEQRSTVELLEELVRENPRAYAQIDRANRRRVIRAVEVQRLTGLPGLAHRAEWTNPRQAASLPRGYRIDRKPEDLQARIRQRVDRMISHGLVEETRSLMDRGLMENRTALQAIGYRQIVEHLLGQVDWQTTLETIRRKTWQFVRRQRNWFVTHFNPTAIPVQADDPAQHIANVLTEQHLMSAGNHHRSTASGTHSP